MSSYPLPRDLLERSCHAALSRYKIDVDAGMWRVTADNKLVDALLKAADKYALTEQERRALAQQEAFAAVHPSDTRAVTRQRREQLDDARSQAYVAALRRGREASSA